MPFELENVNYEIMQDIGLNVLSLTRSLSLLLPFPLPNTELRSR